MRRTPDNANNIPEQVIKKKDFILNRKCPTKNILITKKSSAGTNVCGKIYMRKKEPKRNVATVEMATNHGTISVVAAILRALYRKIIEKINEIPIKTERIIV